MKYLLLFVIATFSASAQTGNTGANASPSGAANGSAAVASSTATNVSAEFTRRIDSRSARVGDQVSAKLTSAATLSDGTTLPKNTKLIGKVTDVHAKSKEDKSSRLAFSFHHAVLKGGRQIPVRAMLESLSVPLAAAPVDEGDLAAGPGMTGGGGSARGGGGAQAGGGGAQAGGGGRVVAGAAANNPGTIVTPTGTTGPSGTLVGGTDVNSASRLEHMSIANLPGVTFSSAADGSDTAALSAEGRNIDIESGAKMALRLSAGQQ